MVIYLTPLPAQNSPKAPGSLSTSLPTQVLLTLGPLISEASLPAAIAAAVSLTLLQPH